MIYKSPFENVVIPEIPLSQFVLSRAEEYGDKPALIEATTGRTITHKEFAQSVRRVAYGLSKRGFGQGDVMIIFSTNIPEYAIAAHGVLSLGGIPTTANPIYSVNELKFQIADSGAIYAVTIPAFLDKVKEAIEGSAIKEVFVFGEAEGATPFAELMAEEGDPPEVEINVKEDTAALLYSSGTTGFPKGVMLTHYNMVANINQLTGIEAIAYDDVLIAVLPFYHIFGFQVIMNVSMWVGATVITVPKFDLAVFLKTVQDYGATRSHLVPPIILLLAKSPVVDEYDVSSLRIITCGAAPLSKELTKEAMERLDCVIKQGYGLTETSPATHVNPDDDWRYGAAGVTIRNTETRIVDVVTGENLPVGERGEVWVRGPQVMKGYLNNPEATAHTVDEEGWLHTGDIGYIDDDGFLYVVDRLKELIKYKGNQVPPAELEALILTHPAVADTAVIPKPDELAGEIPKAFVVLKPNHTLDADELMQFVAENIAPTKKVRAVEFIDQIPKTASGKILRRVLVERERAQT